MNKKILLFLIVVNFILAKNVYAYRVDYPIYCPNCGSGTTLVYNDEIIKQDMNSNHLDGATFVLKDINDSIQIKYSSDYDGRHRLNITESVPCRCSGGGGARTKSFIKNDDNLIVDKLAKNISTNNALSSIEKLVIKQFDNISSYEDLKQKVSDVYCREYTGWHAYGQTTGSYIDKNSIKIDKLADHYYGSGTYAYCSKGIVYPMIVEETIAPKGYIKSNKYVVLLPIDVTFYENYDGNDIDINYPQMLDGISMEYYNYDSNYDYSKMYKLSNDEITNFKEKYLVTGMNSDEYCEPVVCETVIGAYCPKKCYPTDHVIKNSPGEIKLSLTNSINGSDSTTVKKGEKVKYRAQLKNSGTAASYNNVITTVVPPDIEYIDGSASNGGTYNDEDRTITWDIYSLDAGESTDLSYDATVIRNTNIDKIQLRSSVVSDQVQNKVDSAPAIINVKGGFVNPNTGSLISIIMSLMTIILFLFMNFKYFRKKSIIKE